jgi:hypothetical protein
MLGSAADKGDRFLNDIGLGIFDDRDANFGLQSKADIPGSNSGRHGSFFLNFLNNR